MSTPQRLRAAQINWRKELGKSGALNSSVAKISSNREKKGKCKVVSLQLHFEDHTHSETTCFKRSRFFNTALRLESAFLDHSRSLTELSVLKQSFQGRGGWMPFVRKQQQQQTQPHFPRIWGFRFSDKINLKIIQSCFYSYLKNKQKRVSVLIP